MSHGKNGERSAFAPERVAMPAVETPKPEIATRGAEETKPADEATWVGSAAIVGHTQRGVPIIDWPGLGIINPVACPRCGRSACLDGSTRACAITKTYPPAVDAGEKVRFRDMKCCVCELTFQTRKRPL